MENFLALAFVPFWTFCAAAAALDVLADMVYNQKKGG